MRNTFRVLSLVGILFLGLSTIVRADTYVIFAMGTDESVGHLYGLDSAGDVYLSEYCGPPYTQVCLGVFDPRQMIPAIEGEFFQNAPSYLIPLSTPIAYDNGTPCNVNAVSAVDTVCNNGYFAFDNYDHSPLDEGFGINIGPTPPQFVNEIIEPTSQGAFIAVDSLGDVTWSNQVFEINYEAYDLTTRQTPEPNTWVLMVTGFLGLLGVARREYADRV
jgi:hypothetical protein